MVSRLAYPDIGLKLGVSVTPTPHRPAGHLQKTLGFAFAMAIGIGTVIGAGILRTPGPVADLIPSPWLILGLWGLVGTPDVALGLSAVLMVALIFSGGFEFLFLLMGALAIFVFVAYDASLFGLRIRQPDLPRPFRAIGYPWLPGLVLLLDTSLLIAFLAADPWSGLYMLALIALCIPVGHHLAKQRKLAAAV